jgi:hypothetical protein
VHDNFSLLYEFDHIKKVEDEIVLEFLGIFVKALQEIHPSLQANFFLVDNDFAFDSEFRSFLWSENPTNLGQAFCTALGVHEFFVAKKGHNTRSFACDEVFNDEGIGNDSCLNDYQLVVALLGPYAEFHEDEEEESNV